MIARLAGRTHEVWTRFALGAPSRDGAVLHAETVVTRVTFRALTAAQIRAYAESGEGTDKAGAYAVQGLGRRHRLAHRRLVHERRRAPGVRGARRARGARARSVTRRDALVVTLVALFARLGRRRLGGGLVPAQGGRRVLPPARDAARAMGTGYTWLWPDGVVTCGRALSRRLSGADRLGLCVVRRQAGGRDARQRAARHGRSVGAARPPARAATSRRLALAGGLVVALHPALVPYTAALMTEGVTASLLVIAAALCRARTRRGATPGRDRLARRVRAGAGRRDAREAAVARRSRRCSAGSRRARRRRARDDAAPSWRRPSRSPCARRGPRATARRWRSARSSA